MMKPPRLCIVGPLLGRNPGWVISQGEILSHLLEKDGYSVKKTSRFPGRVPRLADTVSSLIAWRNEIDLVILMVFSGNAFGMADISSLLAQKLKKPVILWLHGGDLPGFYKKHPHWTRRVLDRGLAICSPSDYLASYFRKGGMRVEVIPNIVEIKDYPFCERGKIRPNLLWMRTFHSHYAPETAVEVLEKLEKSGTNYRLSMAGQDKGLLQSTIRLADQKGLSANVRFPGFLDMPGKQREFSANDIFINTNRVDNTPVSIIEAAAFGLPVVATRVGGIPYLLEDEKTALLVDSGDTSAMAAAVERLYHDPNLCAHLSRNGRCLAEKFRWQAVKPQWEAIFTSLSTYD
jgi:glycosyltransferase involved in cell wall biosynthesis